ncbi:MAG: hypothetical protein MZV63_33830 [Marinilabiliales bacterium]|nr:hypothetical protein [Marinilabiliales bacterium]
MLLAGASGAGVLTFALLTFFLGLLPILPALGVIAAGGGLHRRGRFSAAAVAAVARRPRSSRHEIENFAIFRPCRRCPCASAGPCSTSAIACLVLLLRLWYLQILEGDRYFTPVDQQSPPCARGGGAARLHPGPARRGAGRESAHLRPVRHTRGRQELRRGGGRRWPSILNVPPADIEARLAEAARTAPSRSSSARTWIDAMMVAVEERRLDLPGINLRIRPIRAYPDRRAWRPTSWATSARSTRHSSSARSTSDFRPGENLGQSGVERRFDAFIRGVDGGEQVEVDARGRAAAGW